MDKVLKIWDCLPFHTVPWATAAGPGHSRKGCRKGLEYSFIKMQVARRRNGAVHLGAGGRRTFADNKILTVWSSSGWKQNGAAWHWEKTPPIILTHEQDQPPAADLNEMSQSEKQQRLWAWEKLSVGFYRHNRQNEVPAYDFDVPVVRISGLPYNELIALNRTLHR